MTSKEMRISVDFSKETGLRQKATIFLSFLFIAVLLQGCVFLESWIDIEPSDSEPFKLVYSQARSEIVPKPQQNEVIGMVSFESRLDLRSGNWRNKYLDIFRKLIPCDGNLGEGIIAYNNDRRLYDEQGPIPVAADRDGLDYELTYGREKTSGPPFKYHVFIYLKEKIGGSSGDNHSIVKFDLRAHPQDLCITVEGNGGAFRLAQSNQLRIPAKTVKQAIDAFDPRSSGVMRAHAP